MREIKNIIVGITGASGAPIAVELLKALKEHHIGVHLVISDSAKETIKQETDESIESVEKLASVVHDNKNIGASIASGSFKIDAMVVCPCSMNTLAAINAGIADNLLLRAADVTIKEHRKLILVPRECPFSPIHLRNMHELSQIGVVIIPAMLSYYSRPKTIEDETKHMVGKILDFLDIEYGDYIRWK